MYMIELLLLNFNQDDLKEAQISSTEMVKQ